MNREGVHLAGGEGAGVAGGIRGEVAEALIAGDLAPRTLSADRGIANGQARSGAKLLDALPELIEMIEVEDGLCADVHISLPVQTD
jgi:hypothetical protein